MKRVGNLFEQVVDRDNLRLAFARASRGKSSRQEVRQFATRLEARVTSVAAELRTGRFSLGRFHQFVIHDPKERIITAPCFAERLLHHAVMNVCEPIFERCLISDSYACRRGRGRIAALLRAQSFGRGFRVFLKMDVRRYFDSIWHDRLLRSLERLFKDRQLLTLFERILHSFRTNTGRGLPIGSLTSQHFANFYLAGFDRFVKETLHVPAYVRYMDDLALWGRSMAELRLYQRRAEDFLRDNLGLELKPSPYFNRTDHGMDFLGCRVFASHMILNRRSRLRYRRKMAELERSFATGQIDETDLQQRALALSAFTRTTGLASWRFRSNVLKRLPVSGHRARTG